MVTEDTARQTVASGPAPKVSIRRGVIVGLVLIPLNGFWLAWMEMVGNMGVGQHGAGPYPSTFSLFANALCLLILLLGVNTLLNRWHSGWALSRQELLTAYLMLVVATAVAGTDFVEVLVPMLGHATRFATPENRWADRILPHLPTWLTVQDAEALRGWYEGASTPYTWQVLRAWGPATLAWTLFIAVMLFTMLCMVSLVSRPWIQHERLSFPTASVPLLITAPGRSLFCNRAFLAGAAIAGVISLTNQLNILVPTVPQVPVRMSYSAGYFFTSVPWRAIGWTPITFYPFAIGLGFLMPLDLLFSSWFFYLFFKAERVFGMAVGWMSGSTGFPYVEQQCYGAFMAIALLALRRACPHFARAWRAALRWKRYPGEETDALSPRWAAVGSAAGFLFLAGFFSLAGLSVWLAVVAFLLYFLLAFAMTRVRAELGPPSHDLRGGGPDAVLVTSFGTDLFGARNLSVLTYFYWFNRDFRSLPMPNLLDALYLARRTGIPPRALVLPLVAAGSLGGLCAFWALLHFGYTFGAQAQMADHVVKYGNQAFSRLDSWVGTGRPPDIAAVRAIAFGAALSFVLYTLRLRLLWWPLHPIGMALAGSFQMNTIWVPLLIAWGAKWAVLRFGGLRLYSQVLPFFLGLIVADFVLGMVWPTLGWALSIPYYSFQQ